tara:strand:+ start:4963 stop:6003 length:1041 start_codon:yes stop_codon:yes gene_type:complete
MPNHIVSQARSFRENPNHYPRKLKVRIYNALTKKEPNYPLPNNPKKILIQSQEKIGDGILLFPLIYGMKSIFADCEIHILCSRKNVEVFRKLNLVDDILVYRTGKLFWKSLTLNEYDLFYNPKDHPSITSFRIAKNVRAKVKVCTAGTQQEQHYNYAIKSNCLESVIEKNCLLLKEYQPKIKIVPWLSLLENVNEIKNQICINISADSNYRIWPIENWIQLIDMILSDDPSIKIKIISMDRDQAKSKIIENKFGKSIKSFPQFNSILESSSIIQQSKMLISSDTAMIHLSDAAQTPVLGLFSADNRNVSRYKPFWVKNKIVQSDSLSIKNISPKRVFSEYNKLVVD